MFVTLRTSRALDSETRDNYDYEIFSVFSALARTSTILGRKRVSHCHSTTSFSENVVVAVTSYQILEFLIIFNWERAKASQ